MKSSRIGRSLCFSQLIAQSPPCAHLAAVYRNFDWDIARFSEAGFEPSVPRESDNDFGASRLVQQSQYAD
jgi:hypothetical protein